MGCVLTRSVAVGFHNGLIRKTLLISVNFLVHAVFVDPLTWWAMRFVTGFAYAGLFVVSESWLNDASENDTRGQMMSFYMLISLAGMAGGQ